MARPSRASSSTTSRLVSLQQVSQEYGPPYTSLRDLVLRGHLPAVRLGQSRRIWVRRADIEKLIERSTTPHRELTTDDCVAILGEERNAGVASR